MYIYINFTYIYTDKVLAKYYTFMLVAILEDSPKTSK